MEIKHITGKEMANLVNLESAAFKGQGEDIFTLAMIAEVGWVLGAFTEASKLTGAIEILPTKKPGLGFIHGLIVEPEWQYKGIGGDLLKIAEDHAKANGFDSLACTISPSNGPSLNAFINKSGFKGTEFYYDYYGPGEHRFWVEKKLDRDKPDFDENGIGQTIKKGLPSNHLFIAENDFSGLDHLLNYEHGIVNGVVRPKFSGLSQNILVVAK